MHCTNTFPLISPAAYYAARGEGVPIVQSLHNYRLFCLNACFLRNDRVCEDCLGKGVPWPGILHGCYRSSRPASAVVAGMLSLHRVMRTWSRMVDRYFTLTEFSRRKFIEGGCRRGRLRSSRILSIRTRVRAAGRADMPSSSVGCRRRRDPDPVVGLESTGRPTTLENHWRRAASRKCKSRSEPDGRYRLAGKKTTSGSAGPAGEAACLVMPSIVYETFGRTIIEAYAKGTPVVASRLGAMAELVHDGRTAFFSSLAIRPIWR